MKHIKYLILNIFMTMSLFADEITSYVHRAVISHDNTMMALSSYADKKNSIYLCLEK